MRHWAEEVVRDRLLARGWILLEENAVLRRGELDLVMRDGKTIVAVEVRQRANDRYGDVAETLSRAKLLRTRRALRAWVYRRCRTTDVTLRVDAGFVRGTQAHHRVDFHRNVG